MAQKRFSDSTVLVTGAGGFIGSHLCELCLQEGAAVRAFVHYNSRNDWGMLEHIDRDALRSIEVISGDLRDSDAVRKAAKGCDLVMHLGALIGIPYSYANPSDVVNTNVLGTLNVLRAGLDCGVRRVVQTSTSEVYGTAKYVPMDEDHALNPQSPYAATKIAGDMLARSYHHAFGLPVTVVRPFNAYGPRQSPRAVIPAIIVQALRSEVVSLGNPAPRRDFTYVTDTARGFVAAAATPEANGQVVQLGSGTEIAIGDIVGIVGKILGKELRIQQDTRRVRPGTSEVQRLFASNRRAGELIGWRPEISLEAGLHKTIEWFRERADAYKFEIYHV
jgi:NAD dependent epimerase/dehydratase